MFYITGDTHGEIDIQKLSNKNLKKDICPGKGDYVIILGDFGLPFLTSDTTNDVLSDAMSLSSRKSYLYWIKWLASKPYTILWVDGNHDNHPYWNEQKPTKWNGGLINIHPLAKNVIHLKRGEYYEIDGITFWTMGGAASHDKQYRTAYLNWWPEEMPNQSELQHGIDTLEQHGNKVDFILTHTMPQKLIEKVLLAGYPKDIMPILMDEFNEIEPLRKYFDIVYEAIDFKYWFCGHFHDGIKSSQYKIQILYNEIVKLNDYQ